MKVVHFSTSISNSSACTSLHIALRQMGIDSKIYTYHRCKDKVEEVYYKKPSKFVTYLNIANGKMHERLLENVRMQKIPFSELKWGEKVRDLPEVKSADVIHLHWICGFLSPRRIQELAHMGKPIVWTCHDEWPFTGGCHCIGECQHYLDNCGRCPALLSKELEDISYRMMKNKRKYLNDIDITFIAPSNWMGDSIKRSGLFKDYRCEVIPNTLRQDIFKVRNEVEVDTCLNYKKDKNKIHILFGAYSIDTPYKGFEYVMSILKKFLNREGYKERIVLHITGYYEKGVEKYNNILKNFECVYWGFVDEREKLACIYNLADVLLYPSLEDNLPNMVLESLACATPVVAFDTGGISDMVIHKKNGYIAKYKCEEDLFTGLLWVIDNNKGNCLGLNGSNKISSEFNEKIIANRHIDVYKSLIKGGGEDNGR